MSDVKRCKQCGLLKDVSEFRPYTYSRQNETGGRFSICRSCESMNTKYARLKAMPSPSMAEGEYTEGALDNFMEAQEQIRVFEDLFKLLESKGLHTPLGRKGIEDRRSEMDSSVGKLLEFYRGQPTKTVVVLPTESKVETPNELQHWLDESPDVWIEKGLSPEFLQETIYESLKAKYRPQIGVNQQNYMPLYDDTYRDILNQILRKFDDYEEQMAGREDE